MQVLAVAVAAALHLSAPHIAVDLPAGWHGYAVGPQRRSGVWTQEHARLANFPLPAKDDDLASNARRVHPLGRRDVLVVVLGAGRYTKAMPELHGRVHVTEKDLGPPLEGFPLGHAFATLSFRTKGRGYSVWVAFGAPRANAALLGEVNRVLATLRLG